MKIKKTVLVAILIIMCISMAKAQSGITIGTNISNLYVDNVDDENAKVGLNIGVYRKKQIAGNLSIYNELVYAQKGAALQYNNFLQGSGKYRFNLNYIKLPIMLSADLGVVDIYAGPYASLLVGVNIKDVDGDGNIRSVQELDRDDFNTFDYGAIAGVGFNFTGGSFGLRYNYGLREIGKSGSFAGEAAEDAKNSALTLYLNLSFENKE